MRILRFSPKSVALSTALLIAGATTMQPANALSKKEKRTLVGAAVGALGGSLVSGGDTWGTLGGALAGGTIGNITTKERDDWHDRDRRNDSRHRDPRDDRRKNRPRDAWNDNRGR